MDNRASSDAFLDAASAIDLSTAGDLCIPIPRRFIPYLINAIDPYRWPDLWTGPAAEVNRTCGQVENILAALITGAECGTENGNGSASTECPVCGRGGAMCYQECDFMPCIDFTDGVKIENGILYAKDDCCNWVAVGSLEAIEAPTPPEVLDEILPEGQTANACGRAYAVWATINKTVKAIWDNKFDVPWNTIPSIKADAGINLTASGVWTAVGQAIIVDGIFGGDDVEDEAKLQDVLCRIEANMEASTNALSDDEWSAIKAAYTNFGDIYDLPIQNLYLVTLAYAITRDRLSNVAQAGALNDAQDCSCYERPPFLGLDESLDWAYIYDFTTGYQGWSPTNGNTYQDASGLGATNQVTEHRAAIAAEKAFDNIDNGSELKTISVLIQLVGDENIMDAGTGFGTNSNVDLDEIQIRAVTGNDPANGGTYEITNIGVNRPLGAGHTKFIAQLQAEHDTDVTQHIKAVFFGGTGPGPMTI